MSENEKHGITESTLPIPDGPGRILDPVSYVLAWLATAVFLGYFFLGASLVPPAGSLNLFQAITAIVLGKVIVMAFFALNGAAGLKYGIPMVVQMRAAFGIKGQAIPSLIRAVPAIFWYGIQTWVGALALNSISSKLFGFSNPLLFFVLFQLLQTWIASRGFSSVKWFEIVSSFFIAGTMIYIMVRLVSLFGAELSVVINSPGTWGWPFWAGVTTMLGIYSTLMINVSDYIRYIPKRTKTFTYTIIQLLGLLPGALFMCMIGIIGAATTGKFDPIEIFTESIPSVPLMVVLMLFIAAAQFSTNLMANVVPPTLVISDLFKTNWKTASIITGILPLFTFPWLILTANGFNLFVQIYSVFLGPIIGVMLADYYFVRKQRLDLAELYNPEGRYTYASGFNPAALIAVAIGAAIAVLNVQISWFLGVLPAAAAYVVLMNSWILKKYEQSTPDTDADLQIAQYLKSQGVTEAQVLESHGVEA